jgi:hypothetical protein
MMIGQTFSVESGSSTIVAVVVVPLSPGSGDLPSRPLRSGRHIDRRWSLDRWLTSVDRTGVTATTSGDVATREPAMSKRRLVDMLGTDPFARTIYDQLQYVRDASISSADSVLWDGLVAGLETVQTDGGASAQDRLDQLQINLEDYLSTSEQVSRPIGLQPGAGPRDFRGALARSVATEPVPSLRERFACETLPTVEPRGTRRRTLAPLSISRSPWALTRSRPTFS